MNYNKTRLSKRNRKLIEKYGYNVQSEELLNALARYTEILTDYEEHDFAWSEMYTYYHKMWKIHDDALYKVLKTHRPRHTVHI